MRDQQTWELVRGEQVPGGQERLDDLLAVVARLVDADRQGGAVLGGHRRVSQPCLTPADATSGRGLAIVDGSGLDWGIDRHPGGKTVWIQAVRPAS